MPFITIEKIKAKAQELANSSTLAQKLVYTEREGQVTFKIGQYNVMSYRWGSWNVQSGVNFVNTTAQYKMSPLLPIILSNSGLGTNSAQNIDFLYHYMTDFQELRSLEVIKERIANPWLCGLYSTAIALSRYVKANNMSHIMVKALLRGSKWRWIRMETGEYIQQTLYTHTNNSGYRVISQITNLTYYQTPVSTTNSILELNSFQNWVLSVWEGQQQAIAQECEAELAREATRLFSHSDRAEQHFEFKKGNKPAYTTYMGIELELENHNVTELPTLHTIKNHCIFKRDGSLSNGVELCSAPATMDLHLEAFKTFFDAHQANKSKLKAMESCGMHIHVDKAKLSRLHIANIALFMNLAENDDAISKIAGRKANRYCKREDQTYYQFVISRHGDRYQRINFTNERTIEFRLFASTTNYTDFAKRVEFTQAVVDYTRPGETTITCKDIPKWGNFMAYVKSHSKFYPNFVKGL